MRSPPVTTPTLLSPRWTIPGLSSPQTSNEKHQEDLRQFTLSSQRVPSLTPPSLAGRALRTQTHPRRTSSIQTLLLLLPRLPHLQIPQNRFHLLVVPHQRQTTTPPLPTPHPTPLPTLVHPLPRPTLLQIADLPPIVLRPLPQSS